MLQKLTINDNQLKSSAAHAFIGALGIQTLDLRYNKISDIAVCALHGMHSLHNIFLSRNLSERLPSQAFLFRRNLRVIDLNQNCLVVLSGDLFVPTPGDFLANRISLSHNQTNAVGRNLITVTVQQTLKYRIIDALIEPGMLVRVKGLDIFQKLSRDALEIMKRWCKRKKLKIEVEFHTLMERLAANIRLYYTYLIELLFT